MKPKIVKANTLKEYMMPERCYIYENWGWVSAKDKDLSIARARIPPGVTSKAHHLEGVQEIYLITQGKGRVYVGDLEPTEVTQGDVVVIPAGISQKIANISETDLIFYCICTPSFTESCYRDEEA
ncbi:MAG: cupin domain-containing protein [Candidatus Bathyarchaeota archaeon]|nr:cupin domain-containing protein [Candidatus Bathyarchaeota archaeon]